MAKEKRKKKKRVFTTTYAASEYTVANLRVPDPAGHAGVAAADTEAALGKGRYDEPEGVRDLGGLRRRGSAL